MEGYQVILVLHLLIAKRVYNEGRYLKQRSFMWHNYPIFILTPGQKLLVAALLIWSIIWKAVALWKAARNSSLAWYLILLIVNTLGILEIIYIYGFSKKEQTNTRSGMQI